MDEFDISDKANNFYASLGKSLVFCTRFEASCKALALLIGIKSETSNIIDDETKYNEFVNKLHKKKLNNIIDQITKDESDLRKILHKARECRNEVAHSISSGLDSQITDEKIKDINERLSSIILIVAEADRLVCFLLTKFTNDNLPITDFIINYPNTVNNWVLNRKP